MSITRLIIKNYRSIRELDVNLGDINAFVGANDSGKSNIMRALNIILGERWPTQPFNDEDFHKYNTTSPIIIEVYFSAPLQSTPTYSSDLVSGFRLSYDDNGSEYVSLDSNGNILTYGLQRRYVYVSNAMRDEVTLLHLGLDRQSNQVVKSSKWTLYGKLLQHIEKNIDISKKDAFNISVTGAYQQNIHPDIQAMEDVLKSHVREQTGLDLSLKLSLFKPLEVISTLRPYMQDQAVGFDYDCEDAGAGVQSALAIAIARAYSEIVHAPFTIAIEEPELYLHPHGCRHFYKLLNELAKNNVQIIYATHERSFVQLSEYKRVYRVRKKNGETMVNSSINSTLSSNQWMKYASKFDDKVNEVFFADLVIVLEGAPDVIACKIALEKLGLEFDKKNISIVNVGGGGIAEVPSMCEVLNEFAIPCLTLVDRDPGNATTATVITRLDGLIGSDSVFIQNPNLEGMLGLSKKPTKYEALTQFPEWFDSNMMPRVYIDLHSKIQQLL